MQKTQTRRRSNCLLKPMVLILVLNIAGLKVGCRSQFRTPKLEQRLPRRILRAFRVHGDC